MRHEINLCRQRRKIVGLHGIGIGVDEMLQALQSLLKWARPKLILIILLRFIQQAQKNL